MRTTTVYYVADVTDGSFFFQAIRLIYPDFFDFWLYVDAGDY